MSRRAPPIALAAGLAVAIGWQAGPVLGAPPAAAPFRVTCPASLATTAFRADRVPAGWVGAMPQETRVSGAGLLWGPPDESGYLRPDEAKTTGPANRRVNTTRWRFDLPHSYETWVYCLYGPLQLAKRTPPDAVECTASSTGSPGWFDEIVFVCK